MRRVQSCPLGSLSPGPAIEARVFVRHACAGGEEGVEGIGSHEMEVDRNVELGDDTAHRRVLREELARILRCVSYRRRIATHPHVCSERLRCAKRTACVVELGPNRDLHDPVTLVSEELVGVLDLREWKRVRDEVAKRKPLCLDHAHETSHPLLTTRA